MPDQQFCKPQREERKIEIQNSLNNVEKYFFFIRKIIPNIHNKLPNP